MRVLIYRLLLWLSNGLIFCSLLLVVPVDCIRILLNRLADWAELRFLLANVEQKIRSRQ